MKKIAALFLSLMIMSPPVFADDDITVYLNEDELIFEQSPIIQNDSTLVPFRAIFENLDMVVQWFGDEQRVTAQKDDLTITLFINENTMYVNDMPVELNTPPISTMITLVPLRLYRNQPVQRYFGTVTRIQFILKPIMKVILMIGDMKF